MPLLLQAALDLARRIQVYEAGQSPAGEAEPAHFPVNRTLSRLSSLMAPLIGEAGFRALAFRSLHLVRRQSSGLAGIELGEDNRLVATASASGRQHDQTEMLEAGTLLVAHIIALLFNFIGEDLTTRTLRRVWPIPSVTIEHVPSDPEEPENE